MNNSRILTKIIKKIGKNIPNQISLAVKEILEKELKDVNFSHDMNTKESTDIIIYDYMKRIAPTIKNLSKQIAEIMQLRIQAEYDAKKR